MKKYNLATVVFACALTTSAFAGGASPFYMGATVGQVENNTDAHGFDNQGICSGASADGEECRIGDGDTAGHIYGGFQLSDHLAVEIGYADLGNTASYHYTDPATITQDTKGITAAAVGRYRLGKGSPLLAYGKAGVFAWRSEVDSVSDHHSIPHGSVKDNGVDPMIGAGLEYEISHNVSLRAGWDRYYNVGNNDVLVEYGAHDEHGKAELHTLETDVDVYSAGVNFSFY